MNLIRLKRTLCCFRVERKSVKVIYVLGSAIHHSWARIWWTLPVLIVKDWEYFRDTDHEEMNLQAFRAPEDIKTSAYLRGHHKKIFKRGTHNIDTYLDGFSQFYEFQHMRSSSIIYCVPDFPILGHCALCCGESAKMPCLPRPVSPTATSVRVP